MKIQLIEKAYVNSAPYGFRDSGSSAGGTRLMVEGQLVFFPAPKTEAEAEDQNKTVAKMLAAISEDNA